jgi:hypothetical protein
MIEKITPDWYERLTWKKVLKSVGVKGSIILISWNRKWIREIYTWQKDNCLQRRFVCKQ